MEACGWWWWNFPTFSIRDDRIFQHLSIRDDGKYFRFFSIIQDVLKCCGCRKIFSYPADEIIHHWNRKITEIRQDTDGISNSVGWCDVLSMFVLYKWQCVALPMCWCTSVRALFYCYHTYLDHTTNISWKVRAPRRVSGSGAPNNAQNCHLDKINMDKTSQLRLILYLIVKSTPGGQSG